MSSASSASRVKEALDGEVTAPERPHTSLPACMEPQSQASDSDTSNWVEAPAFDYASLDSELTNELRNQAMRLRSRIATTTQGLIEIGSELNIAKSKLGHGQFRKWLEAEVGIQPRAAQRYMGLAKTAAKYDTMSQLSPMSAYLLSQKKLSEDVVSAALEKVALGHLVTDRQIEQFVLAHQQPARRRTEERNVALDARPDEGYGDAHDQQVVELDTTSAALTILEALGPTSARLVCQTLARRPEAILAELEILLSKRLSEPADQSLSSGHPPASLAGPLESPDSRNRPAIPPAKLKWPDIPTFLDKRTSKTEDPIVAASRAKNARTS